MNASTITRRAAMRGIAATATATAALAVPAAASAATTDVDAVLAAWRAWRTLEEEDRRLQSKIERMQQTLPDWASSVTVWVEDRHCYHESMIDSACAAAPAWKAPFIEEVRKHAKLEFAAVNAKAEALRRKVGLAQAQDRADEITDLQAPLISLIERTDSSAPVVVAAKLDLAVSRFDRRADLSDIPCWYVAVAVRGLLAELPEDMRASLAPIAAGEGTIEDIYTGQRSACEGRSA